MFERWGTRSRTTADGRRLRELVGSVSVVEDRRPSKEACPSKEDRLELRRPRFTFRSGSNNAVSTPLLDDDRECSELLVVGSQEDFDRTNRVLPLSDNFPLTGELLEVVDIVEFTSMSFLRRM